MKTLIVVRHAKSSWSLPGQNDFDRPLNERGKNDAPEMAKRLRKEGIKPDAFISSPAKRARKTCRAFAEEFGQKKDDIIFFDKLYQAPSPVFYEVIGELDDKYDTIAVFAHNPGITNFVNTLCDVHIDSMVTCSIFAVRADVKSWKDFEAAEREFLFYKYPREE